MNPIEALFELATPIQKKILENVKFVPETECWEWVGSYTEKNSPVIYLEGLTTSARSKTFTEFFGPLFESDTVRMSCKNKKCVNPSHGEIFKTYARGYWTKERCAEEALKFENRPDFRKTTNSAYQIAERNKWLDEICSHMPRLQRPAGYWTKEVCFEVAKKYKSKTDFARGEDKSAYTAAQKQGWLNEICKHMVKIPRESRYTREQCVEIAKKYSSRKEFKKEDYPVYMACQRHGWLNDACEHMKRLNRWDKR